MSQFRYTKPGEYVAICNNIDFKGHHAKRFTFPAEDERGKYLENRIDAAWYFLNRVDSVACLEAVYPLQMFEKILKAKS